MNSIIEFFNKVTSFADSKTWMAEKDTVLSELKNIQSKADSLQAEYDKQAIALKETHTSELNSLKETISNLQAELQKLQAAKVEEVKAVEIKIEKVADQKAKQIILAETGVDVAKLPRLATADRNDSQDVLTRLNSLTGIERTNYYNSHRDEIHRANNPTVTPKQ